MQGKVGIHIESSIGNKSKVPFVWYMNVSVRLRDMGFSSLCFDILSLDNKNKDAHLPLLKSVTTLAHHDRAKLFSHK